MSTFLDSTDIAHLTGRKLRRLQIEALRKMGIPFFVNAIGSPVVTHAAIEGRPAPVKPQVWEMPRRDRGTKANR